MQRFFDSIGKSKERFKFLYLPIVSALKWKTHFNKFGPFSVIFVCETCIKFGRGFSRPLKFFWGVLRPTFRPVDNTEAVAQQGYGSELEVLVCTWNCLVDYSRHKLNLLAQR
jgi:hypothetical protein